MNASSKLKISLVIIERKNDISDITHHASVINRQNGEIVL